jgi:hypothetical protein
MIAPSRSSSWLCVIGVNEDRFLAGRKGVVGSNALTLWLDFRWRAVSVNAPITPVSSSWLRDAVHKGLD